VEDPADVTEAPRKRGRPAKAKQKDAGDEDGEGVVAEVAKPSKKRGFILKAKQEVPEEEDGDEDVAETTDAPKMRGHQTEAKLHKSGKNEDENPTVVKANVSKKRARPAKGNRPGANEEENGGEATAGVAETPKNRGRPVKCKSTDIEEDGDGESDGQAAVAGHKAAADPLEKRGQKAAVPKKKHTKTTQPGPTVPDIEQPPPRKRGRVLKRGEITRIEAGEEAVAKQLEGELEDNAEEYTSKKTAPRKRSGPTTKVKAINAKMPNVDVNRADGEGSEDRQYWLMKAEQEDREETAPDGSMVNTKFTIDDLRSKTEPEMWDGVRNFAAAKNMRAMRTGDLAFFYASGGKQGRKPGIVGIMEIVYGARPDPTVSDRASIYYRPGEEEKWCIVGVEFRQKLDTPIGLAELQKYGKEKGALEGMQLFTQTRLSVSKVQAKEWKFITEELMTDYAGDDALTRGAR